MIRSPLSHPTAAGLKRRSKRTQAGFTLLEISVVIGIIALLATMVTVGVTQWRASANKSICITQLSTIQSNLRSYVNMSNLNTGDSVASSVFIGTGKLIEVTPTCPAGGTLTFSATVPAIGTAYATCSTTGHAPTTQQLATW